MSGINEPESATQDRVIELISQELGCQYLGDLSEREAAKRQLDRPFAIHRGR